jgi:CheY-like chemotaxis protein/DNA-binding XRE family transcriptional regulator
MFQVISFSAIVTYSLLLVEGTARNSFAGSMAGASVKARFGAAVRTLRSRLGISQEELAERADLHRTYIAGVEGGARNITLRSIEKLARALEVPIPELLAGPVAPAENGGRRGAVGAGRSVEILLVEDNPDDVTLTLEAFSQVRFANRVHVVSDGAAALDFLFSDQERASARIQKTPQLILLDLQLPKVDGLEVLRRIKADRRTDRIPVVVLTASKDSRHIAESRRLGAATYIVKPVDFQNFSKVTPQFGLDWALLDPKTK